jgi:ATP-binding cassette subfamily B protein
MSSKTSTAEHAAVFDRKPTISRNGFLGLWKLLRGYRLSYGAAVLFLMLMALFNTGKFLLVQLFTDNVLTQQVDNLLLALALVAFGFIGLAVLQGYFAFLSGRLAAKIGEVMALRLRDYLFDHFQHLPFSFHDRARTGELIQRATSDIESIQRFFAEHATGIGRILLLFSVNFFAVLLLHMQLALMSVIVIPLVMAISIFFFRRMSTAFDKMQDEESKLTTTLQESLTGIRVVKAFSRQRFEEEKFERDNRSRFEYGKRLLLMHAFFWPITDIITGFQMLLGLFAGALMAINGEITVGMYLAYFGLVIYIIYPIRELGQLIVQTATGMVSYRRISELIKEEREDFGFDQVPPVREIEGAFEFREVSLSYDGHEPVLRDITFSVKPGQTVALLGSTGSGKTSLVNLLPRFYDYTSGSITLDGVELCDYPRWFLRQHIGIVEQQPFLFSRTIRENIAFGAGRTVTDEEVIAAAKATALHGTIIAFPDGYDTLVGEKGVTLSGGQKQRVALARALLKNPRILILDDATSAVDTETESQIREALTELMRGRTTFLIAHRVQSVMLADLILVMDKGRIIERGTHDELMALGGVYRRVFEMQAQIELELEEELNYVGAQL